MKNNKLIILIAPPCSGKSTFIRNDEYKNYTIISTDNIITNMYPELTYNEAFKKSDYKEVRRIMRSELLAAISKKTDIIVDRTNMNVKTRKEFINSVDESYEKIAIKDKLEV
jgi:predicted kinase